MTEPSTISPKCSLTSSATCEASRVRPSNMVSRMVETLSAGLRWLLTSSTVRSNCSSPSSA